MFQLKTLTLCVNIFDLEDTGIWETRPHLKAVNALQKSAHVQCLSACVRVCVRVHMGTDALANACVEVRGPS